MSQLRLELGGGGEGVEEYSRQGTACAKGLWHWGRGLRVSVEAGRGRTTPDPEVYGQVSFLHLNRKGSCCRVVVGGDKLRFAFSKGPSGCCVEGRWKGDPRRLGDAEVISPRRRVWRSRLGFGISL